MKPSLSGGGGLLPVCWWGVGDEGGGGAGPRVVAGPPGEGAVFLLPSELWRCGSSGAASSPAGQLTVQYSGGGGAKEDEEAGGFPPDMGARRQFPGEGGGLEGRGGVLPGAGGRGFSLL